jgi:hypothetical protein
VATDVSLLTPSQVTSASYLLQNQGLTVNAAFTTAVTTYASLPLISTILGVQAAATGILTGSNLTGVKTIGAAILPAVSDTIPAASAGSFAAVPMTTLLTTTANTYMGNGDLGKFAQAVSTAQGYCSLTNVFINSSVNSQNYLGGTFTNTNNMMSGDITAVNLCTTPWSQDLANLGVMINLANLDEFGTPAALVKQIASVGGITPTISLAFSTAGVTLDTVVNLNNPTLDVSDADQKAMYAAMTQITGTKLQPTLQLLGVTTANITSMADLLNPVKIFPNSYKTLTVTNINGVSQNVYINNTTTVDRSLQHTLPVTATTSVS